LDHLAFAQALDHGGRGCSLAPLVRLFVRLSLARNAGATAIPTTGEGTVHVARLTADLSIALDTVVKTYTRI